MRHFSTQVLLLICGVCAANVASAQYKSSEFINPVPIPYLVEGTTTGTTTTMDMTFSKQMHNFDPMGATKDGLPLEQGSTDDLYIINKAVRTWGINSSSKPTGADDMTYLGPTLLWKKGNTIDMTVTNDLPTNSDTEPGQGQTTTSHWHGLNVHAQGDGGPHQPISNAAPDNSWNPQIPIVDEEQTLWYHSHVMMYTTEQVAMGISGIIIVQDETDDKVVKLNAALPHEYGVNDYPLVLQEKGFLYDAVTEGSNTKNTATAMNIVEKPGDGEFRTINGVALGTLNVPGSMVRLRVLNGDTRKSYNIGFSTNVDPSESADALTFYQVATDGGYMGQAHEITNFLINPGERAEFLVDFGSIGTNTEVFMTNRANEDGYAEVKDLVGIGAGNPKNGPTITPGFSFMKFVVDNSIKPTTPITKVPEASMFPTYELQSCTPARHRTKRLMGGGNGQPWTIDGTGMKMDTLNDTVCVNTCETWKIKNETDIAHPFHIHKVQFQITQYVDNSSGTPQTYNYPNLPSEMMGFKDVMIVRKQSEFQFQARFDQFGASGVDHTNGYMYHCHILTHEDHSMMHQFTVVDEATCTDLGLSVRDRKVANGGFALYPNPTESFINLRGEAEREGTIQFVDLTGRVIKEVQVAPFSGTQTFDTSDLPRGLIVVDFIYDDQRFSRKILLE